MVGKQIDLAKDFRDLLHAFVDRNVRFLVVVAYALAVLGREDFIANKRATGRLKDLADVERLLPPRRRETALNLRLRVKPSHARPRATTGEGGVTFQRKLVSSRSAESSSRMRSMRRYLEPRKSSRVRPTAR